MGRLLVILLSCSTLVFTAVDNDMDHHRIERGAARVSATIWPLRIPYAINNAYNDSQKVIIRAGVKSIMENTCVDFYEDFGPGRKLEYFKNKTTKNTCSSKVGDSRNWGNVQGNHTVILSDNCVTIGSVQHETTHALGFDHTQNRPDRDTYLKVQFDYLIDQQYRINFEKIALDNYIDYGIPYEYGSRMHYPAGDYGRDGNLILVPNNSDYIGMMGASKVHTFYDWKMINVRYQCGNNCTEKIDCKNGGYRHPRDCSKCKCTDFHDGQFCEIERGVIDLAQLGKPQTLIHNNTQDTNEEVNSNDWEQYVKEPIRVIRAPENRRIRITIEKITNRYYDWNPTCELFAVEIADGDLTLTGKKFCHNNDTGRTFVSKSNVLGYRAYSLRGSPFLSVINFSIEPESEEPTTPTTITTSAPITTTTADEPITTTTPTSDPITTTTAPAVITQYLIDDIKQINVALGLSRELPLHYWKVQKELYKRTEGPVTTFQLEMVKTVCRRAYDEDKIVKPQECPALDTVNGPTIETVWITRKDLGRTIMYTDVTSEH